MRLPVTPSDLAAWRRALKEEGDGEHLDPTTAQVIAPRLMDELDRLRFQLAAARASALREAAKALERQLGQIPADGAQCACGHTQARAFLGRLREMLG
jgi:hypothetical protein